MKRARWENLGVSRAESETDSGCGRLPPTPSPHTGPLLLGLVALVGSLGAQSAHHAQIANPRQTE